MLSRFLKEVCIGHVSSSNVDDTFVGCETIFMHDHYNASLLNFSNVVYDIER